jgi:hypothetical protein
VKILLIDGKVFLEIVEGYAVFLATLEEWEALNDSQRHAVLVQHGFSRPN